MLLALALTAFSGLIVPAACDVSEGLLQDVGTSPEELGFCDARSGWRRALLTALPLGAAATLGFAIVIVLGAIARRTATREGRLSFAIQSGFWARVARTALVGGWLLLGAWLLAQAAIGLLGDYSAA